MRPIHAVVVLAVAMLIPGCAVSRHQELKRISDRVEDRLVFEQRSVLGDDAVAPQFRQERLDHLTSLRYTLSAADIGLASVRRVVPDEYRPSAYDVLEEVYSTIDWNIPLGPGDALRPLPDAFTAGQLDVSRLRAPGDAPVVIPITPE